MRDVCIAEREDRCTVGPNPVEVHFASSWSTHISKGEKKDFDSCICKSIPLTNCVSAVFLTPAEIKLSHTAYVWTIEEHSCHSFV